MITIPIIYRNDNSNDNIIDYTAMEREFKREMNLLVDEEIKQDNSMQSRFEAIMLSHQSKKSVGKDNDLNPGSRL